MTGAHALRSDDRTKAAEIMYERIQISQISTLFI